jgi:hypothetical protein
MPKYIVKEGILDKFLSKVFGNIAKGKGKKVAAALAQDPVLQGLIKDTDALHKDIKDYVEKRRKTDPALDALLDL